MLKSLRAGVTLVRDLGMNFHQQDCGILHIYKNQKSWYKAQKTLERFKDTGWGRVVRKGNLLKYNIKTKSIVGATFTKGDSVGDIHEFCRQTVEYLKHNWDFKIAPNKIVRTDAELEYCQRRKL